VDVIAYTQALGFNDQATAMLSYAQYHMSIYKKIHFKRIICNQHHHADGIREAEDPLFRQDVEENLQNLYATLTAGRSFAGHRRPVKIYYA